MAIQLLMMIIMMITTTTIIIINNNNNSIVYSLSSELLSCFSRCPPQKNWLLLWPAMVVLCGNKYLSLYHFPSTIWIRNLVRLINYTLFHHGTYNQCASKSFPHSISGQCEEAVHIYNSTPLQELSDLAGLALAYCRAGLISESINGEMPHLNQR